MLDELRRLPGDGPEQGVQGGEAEVARGGRVAPLVLEVGEEGADDGGVDPARRWPPPGRWPAVRRGSRTAGGWCRGSSCGCWGLRLRSASISSTRKRRTKCPSGCRCSDMVVLLLVDAGRSARSAGRPRRGVRGSWGGTPGCRRGRRGRGRSPAAADGPGRRRPLGTRRRAGARRRCGAGRAGAARGGRADPGVPRVRAPGRTRVRAGRARRACRRATRRRRSRMPRGSGRRLRLSAYAASASARAAPTGTRRDLKNLVSLTASTRSRRSTSQQRRRRPSPERSPAP